MPEKETTHVLHMRHALDLANEALADGDWPVAAVIARGDEILSTGRGRQNTASDPTAHAETDALAQARRAGVSVAGATLYCTMEPCPMCAPAIPPARVARLYYGPSDPKSAGVAVGARVFSHPQCHHRPQVYDGLAAEDSAALLRDFFAAKRES